MSITLIINVILGLFLTWCLLSLTAMQVQEWLATRFKWRPRMLEKSLGKMLTDLTLVDQFYNHPLIRSLYTGKDGNSKPSYIPASEFSQTMIDILSSTGTEASLIQQQLYKLYSDAQHLPKKKRLETRRRVSVMLGMTRKALVSETGEEAYSEIIDTVKNDLLTLAEDLPRTKEAVDSLFDTLRLQKQQINDALVNLSFKEGGSEDATINRIRAGVTALSITHPQLKQSLHAMLNSMPQSLYQKENELELVRKNLEEWFNNAMDRLTGWYRRRCLLTTLIVGLLLSVFINIDSINLTTRLWREPDLRVAILGRIENILSEETVSVNLTQMEEIKEQFSGISLPVGWLGSPLSMTAIDGEAEPLVCSLFPNQENEVYGVRIAQQCHPIVNAPLPLDVTGWLMKLAGVMISGIAASPGASFWFDVLKKVMNVRLTGAKPAEFSTNAG